jgi:DNA-directed RNA polymerase specialized sigma24 family protein
MAYTAEEIVDGLRNKNPKTFNFLFEKYRPEIIGHVLGNSGTKVEGEELCEDTIMIFCRTCLLWSIPAPKYGRIYPHDLPT